jgi:SAM-dependent methyltransferase
MNKDLNITKWFSYTIGLMKKFKSGNENFNPGLFSVVYKPNYIIRRELYDVKRKYINKITGRVLDIGCGSKPYKELFIYANEYIGMDTKSSGHEHKDENIDIYYDGKQFPFGNNSFDNAVCFQVLEHVDDINLFFQEITRVTKKDGYILFDMPFIWEEHELPYDFRRYTGKGIQKLLKKYNFRLVKYERYCDGLEMIPQFINMYIRKIKTKSRIAHYIINIFLILPMNLLGILFKNVGIKFDTIYGGHLFLVQNKNE